MVVAILQAAAQLFVAQGYENTSMVHIAEKAGVSVGSLYQSFPSKESLLNSLLEQQLELFREAVKEVLSQREDAPLEERARAVLSVLIRVKVENRPLQRLLAEQLAVLDGTDLIAQLKAGAVLLVRGVLEEHPAVTAGRDLDFVSFLVVHAVDGALEAALALYPETLYNGQLQAEVTRLALRYLQR